MKSQCDVHKIDQIAALSIFYRLSPEILPSNQLETELIHSFKQDRYTSTLSGSYSNKTQSITNTRCNYLYRTVTESIPHDEARDQDIIAAIRQPGAVALTLANLSSITDEM